jgi:hypothetical protein
MLQKIGEVAGKIWSYLKDHGEIPAVQLKLQIGCDNSVLFLALGWLARENKVYIKKDKSQYLVGLTSS